MGKESEGLKQILEDTQDTGEVFFGRTRKKSSLPFPENTVFRVAVGCLNNDVFRMEYEALLTKSYRCQGTLKNPGDLVIIELQGTFDKEGMYHAVARYAIIPEPAQNPTQTSDNEQ